MDYNDVGDRMFDIGRALSCRIRLALLHTLTTGDASVGELVERTGATQPNVSNHLAVLREAGLVTADRAGRAMRYRLASPRVRELVKALDAVTDEGLSSGAGRRRDRFVPGFRGGARS